MTVWVYRDGQLVDKSTVGRQELPKRANLPSPRVSRFEEMTSPVTDKPISSWRERDRDMAAVDAFDRRDLPKDHKFSKGREAQYNDARRSRSAERGGSD
jgi:hypothetical protein